MEYTRLYVTGNQHMARLKQEEIGLRYSQHVDFLGIDRLQSALDLRKTYDSVIIEGVGIEQLDELSLEIIRSLLK